MNEKRKPINSFTTQGSWVKISAWPTKDGSDLQYYIKKSVKNKETGEWKDYEGLYGGDLVALETLVRRAIDFGDKYRSENRKKQDQTDPTNYEQPHTSTIDDSEDIPF